MIFRDLGLNSAEVDYIQQTESHQTGNPVKTLTAEMVGAASVGFNTLKISQRHCSMPETALNTQIKLLQMLTVISKRCEILTMTPRDSSHNISDYRNRSLFLFLSIHAVTMNGNQSFQPSKRTQTICKVGFAWVELHHELYNKLFLRCC